MAHAPPSVRSTPFRKRSTFSRRLRAGRPRQSRGCPDLPSALRSGGLDILAQRFLFGLVFPDPPFDDVADRYQADNLAILDHRQMPEFAGGHHFHDRGDGVGLPAADDLAGHHRADRLVQRRCTAFAERSEEHTSELQSRLHLVCRLLLEKKKKKNKKTIKKKKKKQKTL